MQLNRLTFLSLLGELKDVPRRDLKSLLYKRAAELLIANPSSKTQPWRDWDLELEIMVMLGKSMSQIDSRAPTSAIEVAQALCLSSLRALSIIEGRESVEASFLKALSRSRSQRAPLSTVGAWRVIDGHEALFIELHRMTNHQVLERCIDLQLLSKETELSARSFFSECSRSLIPEYVKAAVDQSAVVLGSSFEVNALTEIVAALFILHDLAEDASAIFADNHTLLRGITRDNLTALVRADTSSLSNFLNEIASDS